jgi:L-amino acid N-acyltransferase YncA|tara:strand:+ start:128 stop:556 length:429 start_codon:yes stop_codon:yes gene_type:complete
MVVVANTQKQIELAAGILYERAFVQPTNDLKALFWYSKKGSIDWVVGYNTWIGRTVQMHVVSSGESNPKTLAFAAYDYPFNQCGVDIIFGVINSLNKRSITLAEKAGFNEKMRWDKMHDNGGDIVLMEMKKTNCKWIKHEAI